jgi:hypothetical protein
LCRQLSLPDALLDTVVSMIFDKADMDGDGEISIDEITTVLAGKKWHILCAILYSKCITLPRQARDKHRGNSKRDAFSYSVLDRCEQYGHGRGANLRHIRRHARGALRGQKTEPFCAVLMLKKNILPRQPATDTGKAQKERHGFLAGDRRGWQRHDLLSGVQDLPVDGGGSNCHWQQ